MEADKLSRVAESFRNVASVIAEASRQAGQSATMPAAHFEASIDREVRRLRADGETQLADAVAAIKHPIARFLSIGA